MKKSKRVREEMGKILDRLDDLEYMVKQLTHLVQSLNAKVEGRKE